MFYSKSFFESNGLSLLSKLTKNTILYCCPVSRIVPTSTYRYPVSHPSPELELLKLLFFFYLSTQHDNILF